jgi:hypothetical protein
MRNKNKNQGFAILETLLAAVTISFIVAISWVVLHHQNNQKPVKTTAKVNLSNYLEIKEWNVYLQLPDTSSKIIYKMGDFADPAENHKYITVSSEALDKFVADHKECSVANIFNQITRTREGDEQHGLSPADTKTMLDKRVAEGKAKKIGLYYYYSSRSTLSPCFGSDIAKVQQLTNEVYDLWDKLPTYNNVVLNL